MANTLEGKISHMKKIANIEMTHDEDMVGLISRRHAQRAMEIIEELQAENQALLAEKEKFRQIGLDWMKIAKERELENQALQKKFDEALAKVQSMELQIDDLSERLGKPRTFRRFYVSGTAN